MKLYSIKDTKIGFTTPFQHYNDATALRDIADAVNSGQKLQINEYIEDKQVWRIGEFNDKTGEIISAPEFVCNLIDLKKIEKGVTNASRQDNRGIDSTSQGAEVRDQNVAAQDTSTN